MIAITLGWVLILMAVSFVIGLFFGIKFGISWVKKNLK